MMSLRNMTNEEIVNYYQPQDENTRLLLERFTELSDENSGLAEEIDDLNDQLEKQENEFCELNREMHERLQQAEAPTPQPNFL